MNINPGTCLVVGGGGLVEVLTVQRNSTYTVKTWGVKHGIVRTIHFDQILAINISKYRF